ncbi:MAG: peptide ABC transporter substrate-binding protein [Firmicutes bacterium]|nr:peptide ABC transporter substrate-binding protein [Bacillota bacterium]
MKKALSLVLVLVLCLCMFAACGGEKENEVLEVAKVDWTGYDSKIAEIKTTTDFEARAQLMHDAEDELMATWCIIPIYYYNDVYMQKDYVSGVYTNVYGTKYFMYGEMANGSTTLRLNLASEPDYLDPALNSSVDGACLAANTFGGLMRYNAEGNLDYNFAESYTVSEDGTVYTFTLRDGLKWSDGSDMTAADFVYSWDRVVAPETAADYAYMFDTLTSWEALDAKTLQITLAAPSAYMLDLMAFPTFFPVKQSEVEKYDDWTTNPGHWCQEAGFISSGAYTLESWTHDESMVYVKNPYFWDAENVKLERLEFMLSADDTAIFAAYNAGNLDFIDTVPTDEIASLLDNPEFIIADQLGTYYISFNIKSDLFAGKTAEQAAAMRQAFSMLINRDYICETVGQTGQIAANAFIPVGMADGAGGVFKTESSAAEGYFDPYAINNDYEGTVAAAQKLLESAGYEFKDGKLTTPINFEYLTNESSGHIAVAEAVQQDLAVLGINMTVKVVDWNVFLDERKQGNYDVARNGWVADFNDPINMLEMWTTESGNNDCQFGR